MERSKEEQGRWQDGSEIDSVGNGIGIVTLENNKYTRLLQLPKLQVLFQLCHATVMPYYLQAKRPYGKRRYANRL